MFWRNDDCDVIGDGDLRAGPGGRCKTIQSSSGDPVLGALVLNHSMQGALIFNVGCCSIQ